MSKLSMLFAASSLAAAAAIAAAPNVDREAIQAQYKVDRQNCLSGNTMQADRGACLYDARLAREAALGGWLGGEDPVALETNRLQRCDAHPADARESCVRLMNGEGIVTGSVEQGLIMRELVEDIPVATAERSGDQMDALLMLEE